MQADFAIIGGTGVYDAELLESPEVETVRTPYGDVELVSGVYKGKRIAFLPRHGRGHSVAPHRIAYRANMYALKQLGVTQVLATSAVGSLQLDCPPGALVIVDDFLDFTKSRVGTFFDDDRVVHVDVTDPYCHRLRGVLAQTAHDLNIDVRAGGTYVCTEGPRFESKAEIRFFQSNGGTVVGMTNVPEVVLAKEAELCYATVCIVTNYAAGLSALPLTHEEVIEQMAVSIGDVRRLFFEALLRLDNSRDCRCPTAVSGNSQLTGVAGEEADA
ncbi:S-methyl-5'-thioadenosine phosphorylase [Alicyclobacillus sp. ALC3]|uniref:S-methyl-5'-thioadenosine phosphorylase n=1 Tax=Alicyclobacillus sp. ALC3 TaxID=2796143 RepID=UPI002379DF6D|nr:S-methyl-5'-thioadenosine phosphorylase [Alicyclobacillus sp. ALC3]